MTDPVLLFCVGATKAGTTWLHRYLTRHPECHLRPIKELHYFDALEFGQVPRQIAEVTRARERSLEQIGTAPESQIAGHLAHIAACEHYLELLRPGVEDDAGYLDYLTEGLAGERVIADVTPAYSLLPGARLAAMGRLLPDVRFLYILRDPLDRLWSHVRMMAARRASPGDDLSALAHRILARTIDGAKAQIAIRCDYQGALLRLAESVEVGKLRIVTYDDLFAGGAVEVICDDLGIARVPAETSRVVHEGPAVALTPEAGARARDWLGGQYRFIEEALPEIAAQWRDRAG